jgi:hypothetical protein
MSSYSTTANYANSTTAWLPLLSLAGPAPGFGLPKPVTILVAHLLLNIKKHHKSPKIFFMQNKCYIIFLA